MSHAVPSGFAPLKTAMGFTELTGPLYGKLVGEDFLLGFRVELQHCNPGHVCHGGMLMNFADTFLAVGARFQCKMGAGMTPTVSLSCDFVAPAPLGAWVEGRGELVKATKTLLFTQGMATVDGQPVMRANGVFKFVSRMANLVQDVPIESLFGFENAG